MKTILPERSLVAKDRIENITKEILAAAKDKIAMIILFGSYARGDWVQDEDKVGYTYGYQSDFDILVIVKGKYGGISTRFRIEDNIKNTLERKGLDGSFWLKEPCVTIIVEPITAVNKHLEQTQYFFSDIKKEGVLLYDSGEFQLVEARDLPQKERKEIAQKYYDYWFESGVEFLATTIFLLQRGSLSKSAFQLHQATESFYSAILLVFTAYKPKLHDILELNKRARSYNQELFGIFPYATREQKKCFELLRSAYVDARYNPDYKITNEQLLYLIERVENLQKITEKNCLEYIANLE